MMEIRELKDGEQVIESGAYRCSMEHYHSQAICPGPSVSSTAIRTVENVSPWAFWSNWDGNPDAYPKKPKPEFDFGSAAHALALGDEVFSEKYAVLPFDSRRTNEAKQWEADQRASGKKVITGDDLLAIQELIKNLKTHPLIQAGIFDGEPEVSLIWQDEITGLWIKARPDALQLNGQVIADLKTCASASIIDCHRSITKYAYHQQIALCIEGVERLFGVTATDAVLIFAEKTAPFHVQPIFLDEDCLYWARMQNRRGIDLIADTLKNPPIPVFELEEERCKYSLPPSLREKLSNQQIDGTLPNLEGV